MAQQIPKPLAFIILDGWGVAPPSEGNAISLANTPNFDRFIANYPAMTILASGESVGLLENEPGNSEVGHMTLGIGRVFYQNLPRVNQAIKSGDFFNNQAFLKAANHVKVNKSKLHLIGILSDGNIQGSIDHLYALLELARQQKINEVYIHVILDGVDSLENGGKDFVNNLEKKISEIGLGEVASISGRYFALDRDGHWDRTQKAFYAIVHGQADEFFDNPLEAIESSYKRQVFDQGMRPVVITRGGKPKTTVTANDAIIFYNLKGDRASQLTKAFVLDEFLKFERGPQIGNLVFVTMTQYEKDLPVDVAFPKQIIKTSLTKAISDNGLKQLYIAETEKYAHVTFFLSGNTEDPFIGEDRVVIPSPQIDSYAQKPEMSALEISKRLEKEILREVYDFIVCNLANPDMLGHTGDIEATKKAIETVDKVIGNIVNLVLSKEGAVILVGDHGNAEEMIDLQTGEITNEHTKNPVPFIIIGKEWEGKNIGVSESIGNDLSLIKPVGILADVTPTILKILNLPIPEEMTGKSLI